MALVYCGRFVLQGLVSKHNKQNDGPGCVYSINNHTGIANDLSLATDAAGKLGILGENGHTIGVDGA